MTKQFSSYEEYLSLNSVLGASDFLSQDTSQRCFLICHQVTELWFSIMISELRTFTENSGISSLMRADSVMHQVNGTWDVLASIALPDFSRIREQLQGISGMGSAQYFELDSLIDKCKPHCQTTEEISLLSKIDSSLAQWKFSHAMLTKKLLGNERGTGGTAGADYLVKKGFEAKITHEDLKKF